MSSICRIVFIVCLCAVSAACSSNSEKLAKEIQDANSWIASAQMVAKSCADGAATRPYAHDALHNFNQQLQSAAKRVQAISDPRAPQTVASLERAQQAITQIDASIEQADPNSLARSAAQLDNEQKQLNTLVNLELGPARQP